MAANQQEMAMHVDIAECYPDILVDRNLIKFCIFKIQNEAGKTEAYLFHWFKIDSKVTKVMDYMTLEAPKDLNQRPLPYTLFYENEVNRTAEKLDPNDPRTLKELSGNDTLTFIARRGVRG